MPPLRSRLDHHSQGKHATSTIDTMPIKKSILMLVSIGRHKMIGRSRILGNNLRMRLFTFSVPGGSSERFRRAIIVWSTSAMASDMETVHLAAWTASPS